MSVGMRLICLSCGGVARLEAPDSVSILSGGVTDGKIRSGVGTHVKMKGKLRACSFFCGIVFHVAKAEENEFDV
jgi:hypothetical protein